MTKLDHITLSSRTRRLPRAAVVTGVAASALRAAAVTPAADNQRSVGIYSYPGRPPSCRRATRVHSRRADFSPPHIKPLPPGQRQTHRGREGRMQVRERYRVDPAAPIRLQAPRAACAIAQRHACTCASGTPARSSKQQRGRPTCRAPRRPLSDNLGDEVHGESVTALLVDRSSGRRDRRAQGMSGPIAREQRHVATTKKAAPVPGRS